MVATTEQKRIICGYAYVNEPDLSPKFLVRAKRIKFRLADGTNEKVKNTHEGGINSCVALSNFLSGKKVVVLKVKGRDSTGPFVFSKLYPAHLIEEKTGWISSSTPEGGIVRVEDNGSILSVLFSPQSIPGIAPEKIPAKLTVDQAVAVGMLRFSDQDRTENFVAAYVRKLEAPIIYSGFISTVTKMQAEIYCKELGMVTFEIEDAIPPVKSLKINHTEGKWVEFEAEDTSTPYFSSWRARKVKFYENRSNKPPRPLPYDRFGDGNFDIKDVKCLVCAVGDEYGSLWSPDLGRIYFTIPRPADDESTLDPEALEKLQPMTWVICPVSVIHSIRAAPFPHCWLQTKACDIEPDEDLSDNCSELIETLAVFDSRGANGEIMLKSEKYGLIAAYEAIFDVESLPTEWNSDSQFSIYAVPSLVHQREKFSLVGIFAKKHTLTSSHPQDVTGLPSNVHEEASRASNSRESTMRALPRRPSEDSRAGGRSRETSGYQTAAESFSSMDNSCASSLASFDGSMGKMPNRAVFVPTGRDESLLYLQTILPGIRSIMEPQTVSEQSATQNSNLQLAYAARNEGSETSSIVRANTPTIRPNPTRPSIIPDAIRRSRASSPAVSSSSQSSHSAQAAQAQPGAVPARTQQSWRMLSADVSRTSANFRGQPLRENSSRFRPSASPSQAMPNPAVAASESQPIRNPLPNALTEALDTQEVPVQPRRVYDYGFESDDEHEEAELSQESRQASSSTQTASFSTQTNSTQTSETMESRICRAILEDMELFALIARRDPETIMLFQQWNRRY